MLGLFGYDRAIQTIYLASAAVLRERQVNTLDELRSFYLDGLAKLAPALPINRSVSKFVVDLEMETQLVAFFSASALDDLRQDEVIGEPYTPAAKRAKVTRVATALHALSNNSIAFARVFDLMVHSIFVRDARKVGEKKPRAGTTSLAPGVIWLAVHDGESSEDLMEILVHELTHLMMFADELVYKQFNYAQIKKKETFSPSAILSGIRPLDKVVHSMVVGTEIVMARNAFLSSCHGGTRAHPSSEVIAKGVCSAYRSLLDRQFAADIITPHTQQIIKRCFDQCRLVDTAQATA